MAQQISVKKVKAIRGEMNAPADKSVSQRAVMMSALARGKTIILNFLDCDDSRRTINAFSAMGIKIRECRFQGQPALCVEGKGSAGLVQPRKPLYIGNSGTTMRLLTGILCAQAFPSVLTGDKSLSNRPMKRIIDPLRNMGAELNGRSKNSQEYPPLKIRGRSLRAIRYAMPVASAQVKSCILLAGLFAQGTTRVRELLKTRDHTERMLKLFGADIVVRGLQVGLRGGAELRSPGTLTIPGDISSCAFFMVAATLVPGSMLRINNVGLNPTRAALITLLRRMGADIRIVRSGSRLREYEPCADIIVRAHRLAAITINEKDAAYAIDELPVICVAACFAEGTTRIRGAHELRVKETDRIHSMVTNLKKMGADIRNAGNDLVIRGTGRLRAATVDSFGDHRTAMSMAVAGLLCEGTTTVTNARCIHKSFPGFIAILRSISQLT
jgi:3-phosphoshikimate 1-carboxyvinyltransferase